MERTIKEQVGEATWESWPVGARMAIADAQATIAALQAVIDDHHRLVREMDVRLNGEQGAAKQASLCDIVSQVQQIQAQLTQRTAELEAANGTIEAARRVNSDLHAELERVRGERDEANELVAALSSKVAEYEVELNGDPQNFYGRGRTVGLRTLILALPQMEGQWEILEGRNCGETVWIVGDGGMFFEKDAAIAHDALLKHRQGMEG